MQYNTLPLGKNVFYCDVYNPDLLYSIARIQQNKETAIFGYDLWHLYELSWLDLQNIPQIGVGNLLYSRDSIKIIESKSLKLYLNSFNNSKFKSIETVINTISEDVSKILKTEVLVQIFNINTKFDLVSPYGCCLDDLKFDIEDFDYKNRKKILSELTISDAVVSEKLYSNLLRTNCPITNQPDWGTITIEYTGSKICHKKLLEYIILYRKHNDFHENCIDNIYYELMNNCSLDKLKIYANYTRRGGIDINPYRSNNQDFNLQNVIYNTTRLVRQ